MKNKKNKKDEQKYTLLLDKEQKKGLADVFVGFTIAGGLTVFSYLGSLSNIGTLNTVVAAIGTLISAAIIVWFRKE